MTDCNLISWKLIALSFGRRKLGWLRIASLCVCCAGLVYGDGLTEVGAF